MKHFPNFKFCLKTTVICAFLASVMLVASYWQWQRYKYKVALLQTFTENKSSPATPLPSLESIGDQFDDLLNKKISVIGNYDFEKQLIIINKRHRMPDGASGPGHWLVTPFKPINSKKTILVSRGFIPFVDSEPESWTKYNFQEENLLGVLQKSINSKGPLSPQNPVATKDKWEVRWKFPELQNIAKQFPYPIETRFFIQRIGKPPVGNFPSEDLSIKVPPSTHFGYTIEWILLALATLAIGFVKQAFPRNRNISPTK
jgi:cytochrome oxidase assembly protein ShyY1